MMRELANLFPVLLAGVAMGCMVMAVAVRYSPRIVRWIESSYAGNAESVDHQLELYLWERRERTDGRYRLPAPQPRSRAINRSGGF
jgi:hypothetical protein